MSLFLCSCFRGGDHDIEHSPSVIIGPPAVCKDSQIGQGLDKLESDLLCLNGSWFNRAEGLLRAFKHRGLHAELYGTASCNEFIFLLPSARSVADKKRELLLQRLSSRKAPVTQLCPTSRGDAQNGKVIAVALPLLHGETLVGAVWLEDTSLQCPQTTSRQQFSAAAPSSAVISSIASQRRNTAANCARPHHNHRHASGNAAMPLAVALLHSPAALLQVSFAASMCLAGSSGSNTLAWLTETVSRLRVAPSMQALTAQLCAAMVSHVRSLFVLEVAVSAALVPPPTQQATQQTVQAAGEGTQQQAAAATTALLFRAHNGDSEPALPGANTGGCCEGGSATAAPAPAAACGGYRQKSTFLNTHGLQAWVSQPNSPTSLRGGNATLASNCMVSPGNDIMASSMYSTSRGFTFPLGSAAATATATGGSAGHTSCGRILATGTVVVPLSAAEAAAVTAAAPATATTALHADMFPLQHTLLQAVLQELQKQRQEQHPEDEGEEQQQQERRERAAYVGSRLKDCRSASAVASGGSGGGSGGNGGGGGGGGGTGGGGNCCASQASSLPYAVIENTFLYVQNVHNPWRDVWLFMSRQGGGSTPSGVLSYGSSPSFTTMPVMASGSCGSRSSMPQSLALLALPLGEGGAALGLYLCFPKRLPGPLLEAVRVSCQELIDKGLCWEVRDKLEGTLAAEYHMLKTAVPGAYAVVRVLNTCDDMASSGAMPPSSPSSQTKHTAGFLDTLFRRKTASQLSGSPPAVAAEPLGAYAQLGEVDSLGQRGPSLTVLVNGMEDVEGLDKPNRGAMFTLVSNASARRRSLALTRRTPSTPTARNPLLMASAVPTQTTASSNNAEGHGSNAAHDFVEFMLASCNGDVSDMSTGTAAGAAAGTGCGSHTAATTAQGSSRLLGDCTPSLVADGPFASIVTIACADTHTHQRMDLLVNSIHATLQEAAADNSENCAFGGDLEQLELMEVLGRGGGGVVLRGVMSGTLQVAVKLMIAPGEAMDELGLSQDAVRRSTLRNAMELAVQSSLSHPNIVQFYATFRSAVLCTRQMDSSKGHVMMDMDPRSLCLRDGSAPVRRQQPRGQQLRDVRVTCILAEYCDGGSLAQILMSRKFPRVARKRWSSKDMGSLPFMYELKGVYMTLLDVALALRHLHSMHLVHRDLKPANLLLKSNASDPRGFTVKLADFGFVLQLTETAEDGTRYASVDEPCGTVTHMAPECLTRRSKVSAAADIYSFGILMWELLAGGSRPFPSLQPDRIPEAVYRGARPTFSPDVPQSYRGLAMLCWRTEPSRRPTAGQLVNSITAYLHTL